jgi:hypothetical protein
VDTAAASISSCAIDSSNLDITLTFNEPVYGATGASTILGGGSVTFTVHSTGSTATINHVSQTLHSNIVDFVLTGWSLAAPVTGNQIDVAIVADNVIYDKADNPTLTSGSTNFSKAIGMVGAIQTAAKKTAMLLRSVGHWIQSSIVGNQSNSPAAARTETAGAALTDGTSTSQPRTQFYQPVPAADSQAPKAGPTTAVGSEAAATAHVADTAPKPTSIALTRSGTTQSLPAVTGSAGAVVRVGAVPTDSGVLPAWWVLGLGVLAAGLVAAAAWMALKFVGDRRK